MMLTLIACLAATQGPPIEPEHAANPVYRALLGEGFSLGKGSVPFPAPTLRDGQSAADQKSALIEVAGSEKKWEGMLRDSVSAPHILKLSDREAPGGPIVRRADLWFVVRADLDSIKADEAIGLADEGKSREVGNMRFEGKTLSEADLKARDLTAPEAGPRQWYAHLTGRLLDRIHAEATDRVVLTRSADSMVVASRTDPAFDRDDRFPNRWRPISRRAGKEEIGAAEPYAGGAVYAKLSRLKGTPGALLAEVHFCFVEPEAWFHGNPILRSKIGLVARDQIRELRRQIASRAK